MRAVDKFKAKMDAVQQLGAAAGETGIDMSYNQSNRERNEAIRKLVRNATDNFYDLQYLRIKIGNRLYQAYRSLHPELFESKDETSEEEKSFLDRVHEEYKRIKGVFIEEYGGRGRIRTVLRSMSDLKFIFDDSDYGLVNTFNDLYEQEKECEKLVKKAVELHPMWDMFFKDVKGAGPLMAAICISYFDIHEARHVSSFWSFAGVGTRVNENGERVAMSKQVLIDVEYIDKKTGDIKTKKSIGYNDKLHTKLLGVFVGSVLKQGKGSKYWECYHDYKNRYENRPDLKDATKMKIHRMAARQCVKAMLRDLWVTWRSYEGYEVSRPYEVEYLGRAPHKYNEAHDNKATV